MTPDRPNLVEAQFMVSQSQRMLEETRRRLRCSQLALAAATRALAVRAMTPREPHDSALPA